MVLYLLFLILLAAVSLRMIEGFIQMYISLQWFYKNRKSEVVYGTKQFSRFIILIPVLREQNIIHKTLERFTVLKDIEKVIFITTEKENSERGEHSKTTFKILQKEKERYKNVEVVHYPHTNGVMSHQLNYACKILEEQNYNGFVLVYNADSVIDQNTIDEFQEYIQNNKSANVIQQSTVFIDNYTQYPNTFLGDILRATALYQSRWTFAHELYRLRNQLDGKDTLFQECGHVVGHGLCIKFKTLENIGYFPTDTSNEDIPLGFFLRLSGEKIHVLPMLEIGESPRTIKSVIKQYTSWFYGVIYYPIYFKISAKKYPNKISQALIWSTLNTGRALVWLFTTYVWLLLFILAFFVNWMSLVMVILLFVVYSIGNNYIILAKLEKQYPTYFEDGMGIKRILGLFIASLSVYLFQSIGPTIAVKNIVVSKIFNTSLRKDKTER